MIEALTTPRPLGAVLLLVLAFGFKQLIADYFLQTNWMARGKAAAVGWLAPLFAHAGVHASLTTLICLTVVPGLAWLGLVDFAIHATIDRIKAIPAVGGRWRCDQQQFWWVFGIDQEAHALTHLGFVAVLAAALG
jgi:hypothetical protein